MSPCTYDIFDAYRKFTPVLRSRFLASVTMFIEINITLLLPKDYYKYQSFQVWNVSVSIFYLLIWYDFALWCRPIVILLSVDVDMNQGPESTPGPNSGQSFSLYLWMLKSISMHHYTKIFLSTAYDLKLIYLTLLVFQKRPQMTKN